MKTLLTFLLTALLLALALAASPAAADTITYQNGASNAFVTNYAGTADTHLSSSNPALNYGASLVTYYDSSNTMAGLLRFDLSSFSGKYARITSISLSLGITYIQPSGISGDLTAYAVSAGNAGWVAGSGSSSGATVAGASTWNHRLHNTTPWAGSPGLSTSGADYNPTPLGIMHWNNTGTQVLTISGTPAERKALVDQWAGTQSSNAGILLRHTAMSGAGYVGVTTAQSSVQSFRPTLTINFTTGPAITVEQPAGTALEHGASTLDFGTSSPGTPAGTRTFTLRNDGIAPLTGIAVSATGGNSGDFVPAALGATSLAPGASTTFTVTFTPGTAGGRSTTLQIVSNDAAASPFSVALTGSGWSYIETWRHLHFNTIENSGDAAGDADPDGDGIKNLAEFAFGLVPTSGASISLPQGILQSGNFVSSFTQPANVDGITYGAEWSTSLMPDDWTPIPDSGTGLNHLFSVPVGTNTALFLRWRISRP